MLNEPTVLAVTLTAMKEALEQQGISLEALAGRVGIDLAMLARPGSRYPAERIQQLWALAGEETDDPLFGFKVGARVRPAMFHALGLGILSSATLLDALYRIERYGHVVSTNGRLVVSEEASVVRLEGRPGERIIMPTSQSIDAATVAILRLLKLGAGSDAAPIAVRLPHGDQGRPAAYRELLGCPVEFDAPAAAITFDAQVARQPILTGNAELAAETDRLAAAYLDSLQPDSVASRVRQLLVKSMPAGRTSQEQIAQRLSQSASTLGRRLRSEGTNYQAVLDSTRRDMALQYLRDGRHSLAEIAFLVGFSDQANFTRAFRRWTGRTPRDLRSELAG
ncbi:MAG TPA: AraC family transcriptional regulator [Steroidobacteraceae bacterium]|nr:AraC family transcriptional regulator [Steroidobacteraceae bacterium]